MLYLVATPIGNLSDISLRAIETLKNCDYIACEDTRHTLKLLNHYEIKKKLVSYHEHNKRESGLKILEDLKNGKKVALVSDAGCPAISDPGNDLVKLMYEHNIPVSVIPGANAALSALMISPFDTDRFCFDGFLPLKESHRKAYFQELKKEERTTVLYEAPHKLKKTLKDLEKHLGQERRICLVKEITKIYESVQLGTIKEVLDYFEDNNPKGEYVLLVEGYKELEGDSTLKGIIKESSFDSEKEAVIASYEGYINKGLSNKDALRNTAIELNLSRNKVYSYILEDKEE